MKPHKKSICLIELTGEMVETRVGLCVGFKLGLGVGETVGNTEGCFEGTVTYFCLRARKNGAQVRKR
jgi:hypothetical protein